MSSYFFLLFPLCSGPTLTTLTERNLCILVTQFCRLSSKSLHIRRRHTHTHAHSYSHTPQAETACGTHSPDENSHGVDSCSSLNDTSATWPYCCCCCCCCLRYCCCCCCWLPLVLCPSLTKFGNADGWRWRRRCLKLATEVGS